MLWYHRFTYDPLCRAVDTFCRPLQLRLCQLTRLPRLSPLHRPSSTSENPPQHSWTPLKCLLPSRCHMRATLSRTQIVMLQVPSPPYSMLSWVPSIVPRERPRLANVIRLCQSDFFHAGWDGERHVYYRKRFRWGRWQRGCVRCLFKKNKKTYIHENHGNPQYYRTNLCPTF